MQTVHIARQCIALFYYRYYLVDRTEHVDEFDGAATEEVELSEYMGFIKIELPTFGHRPQLILHQAVPKQARRRQRYMERVSS